MKEINDPNIPKEFNVIDIKLIDAWSVLTLAENAKIEIKSIKQAMNNINVPEKYKNDVEIKVAEKTIEILEEKVTG